MMRLTNRDQAILRSCAACQVLTTSQVHRWHFDGLTLDSAQKRLRKLAKADYLSAIETRTCTDNLYLVGKEGEKQLRKLGWTANLKTDIPKDLPHHLGVNDARIAIERGLDKTAGILLRYFYAYWELGQFSWPYAIIPDAVFSFRNTGPIQAALELDRGTESLGVFGNKLLKYRTLIDRHRLSTVLLISEHRANVERLEKGLVEVAETIPFLTVALEDLKLDGLAARAYPRLHRLGSRMVLEQLQIDASHLKNEQIPAI